MPRSDNRKILLAIYVAIAIYILPMFPHGGSANELTRWATAASIVEKGSFDIAWTENLIGPNVDTARIGNNIYSNKAPGTALAAVPFYALARIFVGAPDASNIRVSWFVMRLAISTLPLFLLALFLYKRGGDELALAVLLFASPLFIYSLLLFSHVFAAVAVYFAFRLLFDTSTASLRRCLAAGTLCGVAVISEFPTIFAVATFGIAILFTSGGERLSRVGFFVLGGLPFAAFLFVYNNSLFGSPFSMSYAHESFPEWAEVASTGVFGIGFPSITNAFLVLLSPSRGLLFFAPVAALALLNLFISSERSTVRHRVKLVSVLLTIVVISGHGAAHGGWAFGPRYLVIILPLLLDSFFEGEFGEYSNLTLGILFGLSLVLCTLPILTFPFAPPEFASPHNDFWMPLLRGEGWYVPNLANVLGASSAVWTIAPVGIAFASAAYVVALRMRRPLRFGAGVAITVVLFAVYAALPLNSDEDGFRRATIAERFFRPADRLATYGESATRRQDAAMLRRVNDAQWNIADTRAFAPNDFPYRPERKLSPSPTATMKAAIELHHRGNVQDAERLLREGKNIFPFAACEFGTNLAVVLYASGRKRDALAELENVQPLVASWSRPDCIRSRQLIAELGRERGL